MSRHLGILAVTSAAAAVLAACGGSVSPSPTPHPSTEAAALATPSAPETTAQPGSAVDPLLYLNTAAGPDLLMNAQGIQTGTLPQASSTPSVRSELGGRLLGLLHDGQPDQGDTTLVAITPDGSWTALGSPVPASELVDAIGSEDGIHWALVTVPRDCSSFSHATLAAGSATGVRNIAMLPSVDAQWSLLSYDKAGIVLEANTCHLQSTTVVTYLVNPDTGQITDLAMRLGAGCTFEGASDSGAFLCYQLARQAITDVLVEPDGSRHQYSFPPGAELCTAPEKGYGIGSSGVLSMDARFIALSYSCMAPGENGGRDQLLIIDTATGKIIEGPKTLYLDGILWLPDDQLIASQPRLGGAWQGGTWIVSTDGNARRVSTVGTAQLSG